MRSLGAVLRQFPSWRRPSSAPSCRDPGGPIAADHLAERSVSAGRSGSGCPCRRTARPGSRPSAQRERTRGVHSSAPRRDRGARRYPLISGRRKTTIAKLSPSLKNSACARSSRIATSVWANCIGEPVTRSKPRTHLTNGVAMMREMEMGLWLEKAEAELKELG